MPPLSLGFLEMEKPFEGVQPCPGAALPGLVTALVAGSLSVPDLTGPQLCRTGPTVGNWLLLPPHLLLCRLHGWPV